jgi:hypothetical protein
MEKKNSTDEELRGIMQKRSDEKHLEYEEEGNSEDNNVLIEEEIDNEIEANALQKEEDMEKTKLLLFHVEATRLFHMPGIQRRFRTFVVKERKAPNIF